MRKNSIKWAIAINFISKYSTVIVNIIITAILSRLLTPNDFGVVAIVTVFTNLFIVLADLGVGPAIIQNQLLSNNDNHHIFTFTLYLGIFLGVMFGIASYGIAAFYQSQIYVPIGWILSFSLFFNTINTVPNALLLKQKKFFLIGMRTVIVSIVTGSLTIVLALFGFKYYALVFQSVISAVCTFVWNVNGTRLKLKLKISISSIRKISQFSTFQFLFSIVNYFSRNLDNLLIGKIIGSSQLAYYDKSYKLMLYPIQNLTNVITPALQPIFAEYQDNKKYIYVQYMKIVKVLSLLGIFVSVLCVSCSKEIVLLFFGGQWGGAILSFQILSFSIWSQMVTSSVGSIFQSLNNTRLMFKAGSIATAVTVICTIIGLISRDLNVVCVWIAIAFNVSFFINFIYLIQKGFNQKYVDFLKQFLPDLLVAMILTLAMIPTIYLRQPSLIFSMFIKLAIETVAFLIALKITKQWNYIKILVSKKGHR